MNENLIVPLIAIVAGLAAGMGYLIGVFVEGRRAADAPAPEFVLDSKAQEMIKAFVGAVADAGRYFQAYLDLSKILEEKVGEPAKGLTWEDVDTTPKKLPIYECAICGAEMMPSPPGPDGRLICKTCREKDEPETQH
jgi:hypothetical protein